MTLVIRPALISASAVSGGNPKARAVQFFLDGNNPAILPLVGDGFAVAWGNSVDAFRHPGPRVEAARPLVARVAAGSCATRSATAPSAPPVPS